jgi:hypothetical protein
MSARPVTMARATFEEYVASAKPGDQIIYHVGLLWWDTNFGIDFMKAWNTRKAAWEAMEAGKVTLVQKKLSDGIWSYIAVKRKTPHEPVVWMGCYAPKDIMPARGKSETNYKHYADRRVA